MTVNTILSRAFRVGTGLVGIVLFAQNQIEPCLQNAKDVHSVSKKEFDENSKHSIEFYGWKTDHETSRCGHVAVALKQGEETVSHLSLWPGTIAGGTPFSTFFPCAGEAMKSLEEDIKREEIPPTDTIELSITQDQAERAFKFIDEHHEKVDKGEILYGMLPKISQVTHYAINKTSSNYSKTSRLTPAQVMNCTTIVGKMLSDLEVLPHDKGTTCVPSTLINNVKDQWF